MQERVLQILVIDYMRPAICRDQRSKVHREGKVGPGRVWKHRVVVGRTDSVPGAGAPRTRRSSWEAQSGTFSPGHKLSRSLAVCFPPRCEKMQVKVDLRARCASSVAKAIELGGSCERALPSQSGGQKSEMKVGKRRSLPGRWGKVPPASFTPGGCRQSLALLGASLRPPQPGPPLSHVVSPRVWVSVLIGTPVILD